MKRFLVVEDDRKLSEGIALALQEPGRDIVQCHSLAAARGALREQPVDLMLLDVNLPDGSGLALLREAKQASGIPVILLTANDTEMDVVMGLEHGADDYITKPFSLAILRARVNARLRAAAPGAAVFVQDGLHFDFDKMEFLCGQASVELSKTEQKLLRLLVENRGATLTREALLDRVWGGGADFVDENTLSVAVKRLRDKLDAGDCIKTVYGIGYTWVVK